MSTGNDARCRRPPRGLTTIFALSNESAMAYPNSSLSGDESLRKLFNHKWKSTTAWGTKGRLFSKIQKQRPLFYSTRTQPKAPHNEGYARAFIRQVLSSILGQLYSGFKPNEIIGCLYTQYADQDQSINSYAYVPTLYESGFARPYRASGVQVVGVLFTPLNVTRLEKGGLHIE